MDLVEEFGDCWFQEDKFIRSRIGLSWGRGETENDNESTFFGKLPAFGQRKGIAKTSMVVLPELPLVASFSFCIRWYLCANCRLRGSTGSPRCTILARY